MKNQKKPKKSSARREAFRQAVKAYAKKYNVSIDEAKVYMDLARAKLEEPVK